MTNLFHPKLSSAGTIPGPIYLWLAVFVLGAASAVTRKITDIGAQHFMGMQNPISFCNVLFVGNLCGLLALTVIHRRQWRWSMFRQLSGREWISLVGVSVLSGALAPGLIFQALAITPVTNVILIGRLEPPLILALSIGVLHDRVSRWEILGAVTAFAGVALIFGLQPASPLTPTVTMAGFHLEFHLGQGELMTALAAVVLAISTLISKTQLARVPIGLYSLVRNGLGTLIFFVIASVVYGRDHFTGLLSPFLWQWMLLYGVMIVVVGQSLWLKGLRASAAATASIVGSFSPLVGIGAAYVILGEVPTGAHYLGGSVILLGLLLSQVGLYRRSLGRMPRPAVPNGTPVNSVAMEQTMDSKLGFKGF
jgi:drug/metabolite transporter (DMT)-like permease